MKVHVSLLVSFVACLSTVSPLALESPYAEDELSLEELPPVTPLEIRVSNIRAAIPLECLPYAQKCPRATVQVNDLCYRYIGSKMSWVNAKKDCEAQGGFLAKPDFTYNNTALDLSALYRNIIDIRHIWIGASDMESTVFWKWLDGSELDIEHPNWYPGHPGAYGENCALITQMKKGPLQISKDRCQSKRVFLCQFKPLF